MTFDAAKAAEEAVATARPFRLITWPGEPSRTLALVLLSEGELERVTIAAARYLKNDLKLDAIELALTEADALIARAKDVLLLAEALRRPEAPEVPAFEATALRRTITSEERAALMNMYRAYERERSPVSTSSDPDALLTEVIALGKDEDRWTWVQCCDVDTLRSIATCMLRRLQAPTNTSSSAT